MNEQPPPPIAEEPGRPGRPGGLGRTPVPDGIDWAAALAEHDRWLRTAVLARLGERLAVDEVLQEVALAAVRESPRPDDPARVGGWLYRVAVRQALLYRRKRGRQNRIDGRYATLRGLDSEPSAPDPLDWLLRDERRQSVRDALKRLPRRDAEILLLKYTEGWSYRDLAGRLGIGESAVEARLHRARQRLREALAGSPVFEVSE